MTIEDEERKPAPGTDEALAEGCTCPVIDNSYGRGYRGQPGIFVYSAACPIHGDGPSTPTQEASDVGG
jgi:hypothetical protein